MALEEAMSEFFKHPMWTNTLARSALLCLLAPFVLSVLANIFSPFYQIFAFVGLLSSITSYVLMFIVARQKTMRDRDGKLLNEGDTFTFPSSGTLYEIVSIEKSGIGYRSVRSWCVRFHALNGSDFVVQSKEQK